MKTLWKFIFLIPFALGYCFAGIDNCVDDLSNGAVINEQPLKIENIIEPEKNNKAVFKVLEKRVDNTPVEKTQSLSLNKTFQAIQFNNNLCLDLYNDEVNNTKQLQLWHCNEQSIQLWMLDSYGRLHPKSDDEKCLALVEEKPNQQQVILKSCMLEKSQFWTMLKGNIINQQFPEMALAVSGAHGGAKVAARAAPRWGINVTPKQEP